LRKCVLVSSSFDIESLKRRLRDGNSVDAFEDAGEVVSAVAIIIDSNRDGGSVLLIRRRDRQGDPWSGQIAFPGGHKSKEDQTLLQTAIREAAEEVGIDLNEHRLLGVFPQAYTHMRSMPVFPFVFELKKDVATRYNEEVAESFWVPLESLLRMRAKSSQVEVDQGRLNVESYVIKEHVIWGLTFRIINVLLNKPQPDSL
jgi:8-oxo-dGTP pyrophosphatase MutT (NUDIX family)